MRRFVRQALSNRDLAVRQLALGKQEQKERKRRGGFCGGPPRDQVDRLESRTCRNCSIVFTPLWRGLQLFCSYQCDEAYCHNAIRGIGESGFASTFSALMEHKEDLPQARSARA